MNKAVLKMFETPDRKWDVFKKARLKQNIVAYGFLAIPLLLLSIFTFFPLFQGVYISFQDYNIMNNPTIGGPVAFVTGFIRNLRYSQYNSLSLGLILLSTILIVILVKKKVSPKAIWMLVAMLLVLNTLPLSDVLLRTLRDINYAILEDRTISNDLIPRYTEMLKEEYGDNVTIIKEQVNQDETRVYIKESTWVGTKFYRLLISNQFYMDFVKHNPWYTYQFLTLLLGFLMMRLLKKQRQEKPNLDMSLKGLIIVDAVVFGVISWFQIFNSQSWSFYQALKNSLTYILVVPPIQIASILLAILVNQKIKGITFFRTLYYVPVITGVVIIGYCWKFIYQPNGLLDATLVLMGLKPVAWLGDSRFALYSTMFVTFWRGLGYYMVLYLAGIQDISHELLEAAKIDGASNFKLITKIYIPLLRRTILVCSVLSTIAALRVFEEIYVLSGGSTGSAPMNGTITMVYMIFDKAFGQFGLQFSHSAALAVILSIFIGIFTLLNFKLERRYDQ